MSKLAKMQELFH